MGTIPERLVEEITRKLGEGTAEVHPGKSLVTVGTERDLAGLPSVALAVAADVDGMLTGVSYRSSEEALRQLGRLALSVGEGRGARLMLQTSHPDSFLITTLRRGDPIPYLERVLVERARAGAPPAAEMIAIEVRGDVPDTVASGLAGLDGAVALGPMVLEEGQRWLVSGQLGRVRAELRRLVGQWWDRGLTVRVDADPIDV
jgi:primosomal protein N' (replication factor Y)